MLITYQKTKRENKIMTKKHFKAIAEIIKRHCDLQNIDSAVEETVCDIISDLSDFLATTNPLFDRTKFLDACGIE